jgi:polysaccharide export outer membrane protein
MKRNNFLGLLFLAALTILCPVELWAQAYVIGPEDVLEVTFWQDESLNATIKVRQDGKISLDIIGEINAAGLTTGELEKNIVKQMSRYNKAISHAVVRITEYGYRKVYITGQVLNPGKYTFEQIPDLYSLINEAGGVTEEGDLSRVMVVRGGDKGGEVEVVNVSAMVASGNLEQLPKINPGDAIEIPLAPAGLPGRALSDRAELKNIFYVTGEVHSPGALTLEPNIDILDAVALAGGPTEFANLKNVRVVSKDGSNTQSMKINLKKYAERGISGRYIIRPEDNIILPRQPEPFFDFRDLGDWVTVLGGVMTVLIIKDLLEEEEGERAIF